MMRCKQCGGPVTALFTSVICQRCDDTTDPDFFGYIVFRKRPPGRVNSTYVFKTAEDADLWRQYATFQAHPIRRVESDYPFTSWVLDSEGCGGWHAPGVYFVCHRTDDPEPAQRHCVYLID